MQRRLAAILIPVLIAAMLYSGAWLSDDAVSFAQAAETASVLADSASGQETVLDSKTILTIAFHEQIHGTHIAETASAARKPVRNRSRLQSGQAFSSAKNSILFRSHFLNRNTLNIDAPLFHEATISYIYHQNRTRLFSAF